MERKREPELMDDAGLDPTKHEQALNDLTFLNMLSGSPSIMLREIFAEYGHANSKTFSILDIATGAGDIPIALARAAKQAGIQLDITASDISDRALKYVNAGAQHNQVIVKTLKLDILSSSPKAKYDVVTTSLFTHHLDPPEVVELMRSMAKSAKRLVLINDLVRSPINLTLIKVATKLLTSSEVVQYDGPVSVKAAYTIAEMRELADNAGLKGAKIEPKFPCRMLLSWKVKSD